MVDSKQLQLIKQAKIRVIGYNLPSLAASIHLFQKRVFLDSHTLRPRSSAFLFFFLCKENKLFLVKRKELHFIHRLETLTTNQIQKTLNMMCMNLHLLSVIILIGTACQPRSRPPLVIQCKFPLAVYKLLMNKPPIYAQEGVGGTQSLVVGPISLADIH